MTTPHETNPHFDLIRAWFDARGARPDFAPDLDEQIDQRRYEGVEYYFGEPTCRPDEHVAEVAGLVSVDREHDARYFERFSSNVTGPEREHAYSVEYVTSPQYAVWVARRFTETELTDGLFATRMEELVSLTEDMRRDLGIVAS